MNTVRAELVRSYIKPPPNRTACDCCFDLSCGRKPSSGRFVSLPFSPASADPLTVRSDCKSSTERQSSLFRRTGDATATASAAFRSDQRNSWSSGWSFRRDERNDPPPPYSQRRSSAAPSFLTPASFRRPEVRDRAEGSSSSSSDASQSSLSQSSSDRRKQ